MYLMSKNLPDHFKNQTFAPCELITLQSDCLCLLEQGIVKISAWTQEGSPVVLGYWGQNDIIGKPLNLIDPCRVKCLTEVKALYIPLSEIGCVSDLIAHHSCQTEELLKILHSDNIYLKLRAALVWLSNKFGQEENFGRSIGLHLTHQDLAETIGATRVSITKLINRLEQEGFLARPQRNSIVILKNLG